MPHRLRVLPRQIYSFAQAEGLGSTVNVARIVRSGLVYLENRYRRSDGLYRTLVSTSGNPLDDSALLYDHAFILLGYASACRVLGDIAHFESEAGKLWDLLNGRWRDRGGGFLPADEARDIHLSNPLMHLLEACLEWSSIGTDSRWASRAGEIADLAIHHLIDSGTGSIFEKYTRDWRPILAAEGKRIIEPGHQFEWAWLLLRWLGGKPPQHREAAMRLISFAEQHGVKDQFVVNEIWDDGSGRDGNARLWPQTERLKANLLAYELTGNETFARSAAEATAAVDAYLQTPTRGLWYDQRDVLGNFAPSPSPASSFYHLVGAIGQLASCERL